MQGVLTTIEKIARSTMSVMVIGEHGSGKEWAARAIHKLSNCSAGPLIVVDCPALSLQDVEKEIFGHEAITSAGIEMKRGVFEAANGGTLVLDEIASLPTPVQLRIARTVEYNSTRRVGGDEDIPVSVRVVATMSQQPETLVSDEILRKELFYRISSVVVTLPPLRARREDIPSLVDEFLQELRTRPDTGVRGISNEALDLCVGYDWPGNVRHLRNAIEFATVMCGNDVIQPEHLPTYIRANHRTIR